MKNKVNSMSIFTLQQDIIDNKPCKNPYEMTDEQLRTTLTEMGRSPNGTREQMISNITKADNSEYANDKIDISWTYCINLTTTNVLTLKIKMDIDGIVS